MTPKNLALIRCVLTDEVWSRVTKLPDQLMRQARLRARHAPVRAAVLAQIAVAVAILTVAPVRLDNLASIRLGENLIKPGGPQSNYFLSFNKYDVRTGCRSSSSSTRSSRRSSMSTCTTSARVDARQQRGLAIPASPANTRKRSRSAPRSSTGLRSRPGCALPCISSASGRRADPQTPPRRIRTCSAPSRPQERPDHHQILSGTGDHTGERDLHRHRPQPRDFRPNASDMNTRLQQAPPQPTAAAA